MTVGDAPVWNVSAADHGGQIDDRVASHADLVEPWILTNEMTGQETTVGATRYDNPLWVKLTTFQDTFNGKLGEMGKKNYYLLDVISTADLWVAMYIFIKQY